MPQNLPVPLPYLLFATMGELAQKNPSYGFEGTNMFCHHLLYKFGNRKKYICDNYSETSYIRIYYTQNSIHFYG